MARARTKSPIPLPDLLLSNRNAATVYATLRWLAGAKHQLRTTRQRITEVCGLSKDIVTAAVKALHDGRWIVRRYGAVTNRRWYRISFSNVVTFPWAAKTSLRKKSNPKCKAGKKRSKGARPLSQKNRSNPLKGIGQSPNSCPSLPVGQDGDAEDEVWTSISDLLEKDSP